MILKKKSKFFDKIFKKTQGGGKDFQKNRHFFRQIFKKKHKGGGKDFQKNRNFFLSKFSKKTQGWW